MSFTSVIEKCISIVTGKGSEGTDEQNFEQNSCEPVEHVSEMVDNPEFHHDGEEQEEQQEQEEQE